MSFKISAIICTYNPREDYLSKVLDGLAKQSMDFQLWELLIVDNASSVALSETLDLSWHPHSRILREIEPGLTAARLRGGSEADSELLLFVDDDNVLDSDYLKNAIDIGERMPQLGTWGGTSRGVYDVKPPDWFKAQEGWIGVRYFQNEAWSNDPLHAPSNPIGAGMVVRRAVFSAYSESLRVDSSRKILDRTGESLMSGGDLDIIFTGCDKGWGKGVFPELSLDHLIPQERTSRAYIEKLLEMMACSRVLLRKFHQLPSPVRMIKGRLGILRLSYIYLVRNRTNAFARARERGLVKGEAMLKELGTQ